MSENIEVVFTFDTTGSMYPCLTQLRKSLRDTVTRLFKDIPHIKIGLIAHGDYCDTATYVTQHFKLSDDVTAICNFIDRVSPTNGGDAPECYELVLHEARTLMNWTTGKSKVIALIGDDIPHPAHYPLNAHKIDWRNELGLLLEAQINVYGIQALNRNHATPFYKEIAEKTGGFHLSLDQFSQVSDLITAICFKQQGDAQVQQFEQELKQKSRINRSMDNVFNILLKRKKSSEFSDSLDLAAVSPGRFQVLEVDKPVPIKQFTEENGLAFRTGRGFYEFTKSSIIQGHKEVVLMERHTGDLFTGKRARELLGLPSEGTVKVSPAYLKQYIPFVQSTSPSRKLMPGTRFLYEVD